VRPENIAPVTRGQADFAPSWGHWLKSPRVDFLFFVLYFASVVASRAFTLEAIRYTPFFPPAGIMLWWFLERGRSGWITAIAVRFAADFALYAEARHNVGRTILSGGIVVGVYFVGGHLTDGRIDRNDRLRDTGWFIAIACVAAPAVAGLLVSVIDAVFVSDAASIPRAFESFFIGDSIAIATIVPVLSYLSGKWPAIVDPEPSSIARRAEFLVSEVAIEGRLARLEGIVQALSIALIPIVIFGLGSTDTSQPHAWIVVAVLPCFWVALRKSSLSAHIASFATIVALAIGARWRFDDDFAFLQVQAVMLAGSFATLYAVGVGRAQRRKIIGDRLVARQRFTRDRIDSVTGLLNRIGVVDEIARSSNEAAVICVAIDRFDSLSIGIGSFDTDRVVNELATRILAESGGSVVGRIEDNALAVVVARGDAARVTEMAHRMVDAIAKKRMLTMGSDALRLPITVSAGVATHLSLDRLPDDLLRDARIALHRAATSGGKQVSVFDPAWRIEAEDRHRTLSGLRDALDTDNQLFLEYQPIVRLSDFGVIGGEALVRWRQPDGSTLMPASFIPVAENSGLIAELGDHVFKLAVKQLATWQSLITGGSHDDNADASSIEGFRLHVNLSPRQLEDPALASVLQGYCVAAGVDPSLLCLELVETDLSTDPGYASSILQTLRDVGFHLALDDFGTGFSTVSWLSRFPINALKIDKVFVQGLPGRTDDRAIVELIIKLGLQLQLAVSAEGVETDEQIESLRSLGCMLAQGYRFSRPVSADEFERALIKRVITVV
jgi:diguanylate cyclase (GGDEF)-like protein